MAENLPLAEALRPKSLDCFSGQKHLTKKIAALSHGERLPSILFYGPPGCGKSTLALLLANATGKNFLRLSAPETSLSNLRRALMDVDILILDELHRFSKAQQDFFLPLLENGELVLLATTTENPSFSITRQLLSRLHILRLDPLQKGDLREIAEKGLQSLQLALAPEVLDLLVTQAGGDARALLNLLEYTATLPENERSFTEIIKSLPEIVARHDKTGDSHYELASALIKSIRGSDTDAALYYLAALIEGGEDPRFICRRLILSASEDIGLADPYALSLAVACQQAVEFVGMPEGFIPLAETVTYLALSRKSNSSYRAFLSAAREIKQNGIKPVPLHLRNATTGLQKSWGYGHDYKYPHDYPASWIPQTYLPDEVKGKRFYLPRTNGREPALAAWWQKIHKISGTKE